MFKNGGILRRSPQQSLSHQLLQIKSIHFLSAAEQQTKRLNWSTYVTRR